jgi:hypothetical protein
VVLDNKQTSYTNSKGIAEFSSVSSGVHSIVVARAGNKPIREKVILTPGKNEILTVKLTSNTTSSVSLIVIGVAIVVVLLLTTGYYLKVRLSRKDLNKHPPTINPPTGNITPTTSFPIAPPTNSLGSTSADTNLPNIIMPNVSSNIPATPALPISDLNEETSNLPKPTANPHNS